MTKSIGTYGRGGQPTNLKYLTHILTYTDTPIQTIHATNEFKAKAPAECAEQSAAPPVGRAGRAGPTSFGFGIPDLNVKSNPFQIKYGGF